MLQKVKDKILELISGLGYEVVDSYFAKIEQGKMLRTKLAMHIAGESDEMVYLASIIELIHLASLLHDDVIDESDLRRGKPSINALFGNKNAIMMGDILYSKAFFELVNFDKKIAQTVANAVTQLSIGELLDVELAKSFNSDREKYMDMIYKKTAVLIEATAVASAMLGGKDESAYREYGRNLGLAFQIVDDILDITQDESTLGKPAMSDFKEGKATLPYLLLYERVDISGKEKLAGLHGINPSDNQKAWIKEMMIKTSALKDSIYFAKELGCSALTAIKNEKNQKLEEVVRAMIERDF